MSDRSTDPRSGPSELAHLLTRNRAWAARQIARDPSFFQRLVAQQSPEYFWIGCSDSRVPANEIVDLAPGEVFVHRNVANQVVHTDLNCLSALHFAVDVLSIRHVIVCGHYGCGGVIAGFERARHGLVDNGLRHVEDVIARYRIEVDRLSSREEKLERLCELNVITQVENVCRTSIVQEAWARGQPLAVHGWIYDIGDGIIRDLGVSVSGAEAEAPG
jgi:carbonic anhydrase